MRRNRLPAGFWRSPAAIVATGFGSGAAPYAPGTVGTLVGIPFYLVLQPLPQAAYLGVVTLLFFLGVWVCQRTSFAFGTHDHGGIVWDEIVGYLVVMSTVPFDWVWIVVGFLLFRLFDVLKPWPIAWVDRKVAGGMGIMLDDLIAGAYGWIAIELIWRLLA